MNLTLTLRQLRYFVTIAETKTLRGAASRLGVSQPTLTHQIAKLEQGLGIQLFERSRSGSLLTPIGRELLSGAQRVLEEVQGFADRARSVSGEPAGTYRLGVTPTLGPYLLPYVLPEIHRRYDALKFFVQEAHPRRLEEDLSGGRHDLILTPLPVASTGLSVEPLFREPVRLVLSTEHRLAGAADIDPSELHGEPVLTLQEHHLFHRQIVDLCYRLGARVLRDYEGTSLDTLRQMVVMGMGVAFLPALYARSEIRGQDDLWVTRIRGEALDRTHALVWRPSSPSEPVFRKLAEDIRELAARLLPDLVTPLPSD